MPEPTIGLLASAAGLSLVVAVVMNLLRPVIDPLVFDKWAPIIAVGVAIVLAEIYAIIQPEVDAESIIQAALVGLFTGGFSQNVNTMITRTLKPAEPAG